MKSIRIWCEWDIGGGFGESREDIFYVNSALTAEEIESLVLGHIKDMTSLDDEELDDEFGWNFYQVATLTNN